MSEHRLSKLFSALLSKVHWTFFTSLKDLGKRWFSFNKMEMTAKELLGNVK